MELKEFLAGRQKANLLIIAANFVVFVLLSLGGRTESGQYLLQHGAMYPPYVLGEGQYYRLFTSMFLHFGLQHLVYNMLLLLFLGDILERECGKVRYLIIYLAGGLAGNLLSLFMAVRSGSQAVSAGASGAVFAVIGGLLAILLLRGRIRGVSGKRLALMAVLTVADGLTQTGIDNYAHIGGLLGGFLVTAILLILSGDIRGRRTRTTL